MQQGETGKSTHQALVLAAFFLCVARGGGRSSQFSVRAIRLDPGVVRSRRHYPRAAGGCQPRFEQSRARGEWIRSLGLLLRAKRGGARRRRECNSRAGKRRRSAARRPGAGQPGCLEPTRASPRDTTCCAHWGKAVSEEQSEFTSFLTYLLVRNGFAPCRRNNRNSSRFCSIALRANDLARVEGILEIINDFVLYKIM
jgi:hypothetical protein